MKKLLLIMLCMPLFLACSNDDVSHQLVGTTWISDNHTINDVNAKLSMTFYKVGCPIEISYNYNGTIFTGKSDCEYIYEHPNVKIYLKDRVLLSENTPDFLEGVISNDGKTMTLFVSTQENPFAVFNKQ